MRMRKLGDEKDECIEDEEDKDEEDKEQKQEICFQSFKNLT